MSTISYFTRSFKKGDKEISIWIRVHHHGLDIRQSLHLSVPARCWNKRKGWIKDRANSDSYLKERLEMTSTILNNLKHHIYAALIGTDRISSAKLTTLIKEVYSTEKGSDTRDEEIIFTHYLSRKITEMEEKCFLNRGEPYSKNSIDNWKKFKALWSAFEVKHFNRQLMLDEIDMGTYYLFMDHCDSCMYKKSTKYQYARLFKAALNYALADGVSTNRVHLNRNFATHASFEANKGVYLTMGEIVKLINAEFDRQDFRDKVRDYFLIGCFTGLRFSDCSTISINDIIQIEIEGNIHSALIKRQKKTKHEVVIPLLTNDVEKILMKYGGKLPKISISGYNKYIKEICRKAGIVNRIRTTNIVGGKEVIQWITKDRLISSHTARRTCITNLYLSGKLDMKQIRDISGHKSEQAFSRYICLSQEENVKTIFKRLVQ